MYKSIQSLKGHAGYTGCTRVYRVYKGVLKEYATINKVYKGLQGAEVYK